MKSDQKHTTSKTLKITTKGKPHVVSQSRICEGGELIVTDYSDGRMNIEVTGKVAEKIIYNAKREGIAPKALLKKICRGAIGGKVEAAA